MATAQIKKIESNVTKKLEEMIANTKDLSGFLNRYVYRKYQRTQSDRWMAQGPGWAALNATYAARKKKKYADYPGAGSKILIATGRLVKSVIGPSKQASLFGSGAEQDHRKLVTTRKITIGTVVPYAEYVDEVRSFTEFDSKFYKDIKTNLSLYIRKGKANG